MRYEEFRDVMLAKGYSIVDVFDCIRDYFASDVSVDQIDKFNHLISLLKGDVFEKRYYNDLDDSLSWLIGQMSRFDKDIDSVYDNAGHDLWVNCAFEKSSFVDDFFQYVLRNS